MRPTDDVFEVKNYAQINCSAEIIRYFASKRTLKPMEFVCHGVPPDILLNCGWKAQTEIDDFQL